MKFEEYLELSLNVLPSLSDFVEYTEELKEWHKNLAEITIVWRPFKSNICFLCSLEDSNAIDKMIKNNCLLYDGKKVEKMEDLKQFFTDYSEGFIRGFNGLEILDNPSTSFKRRIQDKIHNQRLGRSSGLPLRFFKDPANSPSKLQNFPRYGMHKRGILQMKKVNFKNKTIELQPNIKKEAFNWGEYYKAAFIYIENYELFSELLGQKPATSFLEEESSSPSSSNSKPKRPDSFEEMFEDAIKVQECINVLKKVNPPVLSDKGNYIGNLKGAFCVWVDILQRRDLIKKYSDRRIYAELISKKFAPFSIDESMFGKNHKRAEEKYKFEIDALLSQVSQQGELGK